MKLNSILKLKIISTILSSCRNSPEKIAEDWSKRIKMNIIEESKLNNSRIEIDSTEENWKTIVYWKNNIKLREYNYRPIDVDTVISIFYSKNQIFELIRELCPGVDRSFEEIRYEGEHLGLAEFRYCNGDIKERGYRIDGDVGVWEEYNTKGEGSIQKILEI